MPDTLEPTQAPNWVLSHECYDVLSESAVESRLAFANGFLGMRAARSVSRGPTWVAWLGHSRWASWPRCYVAGLFDVPKHRAVRAGAGLVAARLGDTELALRYLRETADTDLDLDPNSAGGVRIAGLGALWQAVMLGFVGLDLKGDTLGIDPKLPPRWRSLSFRVRWRGRSVAVRIAGRTVEATLAGQVMEMRIGTATHKLAAGSAMRLTV